MNLNGTRESMRMAAETIRSNPLRSGLTILGILIGVAAVILISSVITGLTANVSSLVESLGTNVLWIYRYPPFGARPTPEMLMRKQLTYDDGIAMRRLPHVVAVDPSQQYRTPDAHYGQFSVRYGRRLVLNTILEGDSAEQPDVYDLRFTEGRFFNRFEEQHRANVVVLGYDTAEELFGDESAVGREVQIDGTMFRVIGVEARGKRVAGAGKDPADNSAHFPLSTFRKLHPEVRDYWISVKYDSAKNKVAVESEIRGLLRQRRGLRADQPDNFAIFGPSSLLELWKSLTGGLFIFLVAVAGIGLMVGGVGVMNIMLVSVTERTREIGVRKALGARRRDVLFQFTLEAIALCAVGGIAGIAAGGLLTLLVKLIFGAVLPAQMSAAWSTAALIVSCSVGLVFGIYPAWKAATLDPIEALRYE